MLDTNIVSELARNPQGRCRRHIAEVGPDAVCVSIVTAAELRYGCAKKGSVKLLAQIEAIVGAIGSTRTRMFLPIPNTAASELSWRLLASRSAQMTCS